MFHLHKVHTYITKSYEEHKYIQVNVTKNFTDKRSQHTLCLKHVLRYLKYVFICTKYTYLPRRNQKLLTVSEPWLVEFIQGCRIFKDIKPLIELTIRNDFSLKNSFEKLAKTLK